MARHNRDVIKIDDDNGNVTNTAAVCMLNGFSEAQPGEHHIPPDEMANLVRLIDLARAGDNKALAEVESLKKKIQLPSVTKIERELLSQLLAVHPALMMGTDIVLEDDCDPKTIRKALVSLEAKGLVDRPSGERSGYGLTPIGLQVARQLAGN